MLFKKLNKLSFFLILITIFAYFYFYNLFPYDNIKTRIYLAYSISFLATLNIDKYESNTIDKAFFNGHYYSDKSPFPSFLAVPIIKTLKLFRLIQQDNPDSIFARYLITLLIVTLPSLISVYFVFKINLIFCKNILISLLLTFAYSLGTLVFPHSTLFYEHPISNNLLIFSLYLILSHSGKKTNKTSALLIGTFLGLSACCEYVSLITSILLIIYFILKTKDLPSACITFLVFSIFMLCLLTYNYFIFGSIFSFGYKHEVLSLFKNSMSKGLMGITFPKFSSFLKIFLLPSRGLFFTSPFLLFFFWGIFQMIKTNEFKILGIVFASIIIIRSTIISSYWEPLGGFSPGPRHMLSIIPFFVLPISFFLKESFNKKKVLPLIIFLILTLISIYQHYIITAGDPHVPQSFKYIIADFSIPMIKMNYGNGNVGKLIALPHKLSVVFPFLIISAFYFYLSFSFLKVFFLEKGSAIMENSILWTKNYFNLKLACLAWLVILISLSFIYVLSVKLRDDKPNWEIFYYRGSILLQSNILNYAERELKKAIELNPNNYLTYFKIGILYYKKGMIRKANKYFETSVKLNPNALEPRISLSASYLILRDYDKAKKEAEKAFKLFPNSKILQNLILDINKYQSTKNK